MVTKIEDLEYPKRKIIFELDERDEEWIEEDGMESLLIMKLFRGKYDDCYATDNEITMAGEFMALCKVGNAMADALEELGEEEALVSSWRSL